MRPSEGDQVETTDKKEKATPTYYVPNRHDRRRAKAKEIKLKREKAKRKSK